MTNYLNEYSKAHDLYMQNRMRCIENHIHHYEILEELLGFQYWVNGEVSNFVNTEENYMKKHLSEMAVHLLFTYNVFSLDVAHRTIEQDLVHQSAVNIRTVYEGIPKMYYISFFPEQIRKIMLKESMAGMNENEMLEYLQTEDATKILGEVPTNKETFIEKLKKRYSPAWFRNKIYSEDSVKMLHDMYGRFSNSTHANIMRNTTANQYSPTNTEHFFETLRSLSYFNIHAEINGCEQALRDCGILAESLNFITSIGAKLGHLVNGSYLFPDNASIINKLRIYPDREPWTKNKK